ncbi:hypothetical protein [Delftia tsuruhatensis]|jgi:hypothetical protein|uniref:hypothetical protein n=1 Tax=Delftia tsuruhatensis TaxID=180282 RepID=UPI0023D995EC|nr:hypothetical protein [Delftia tsuruhatensis]MDH0851795.1 hypothetical protein [Delftia tsuruhatensis]WEM01145.1 hypothetical protein PW274_12930 [Delftia tsuruhatensis]
MGNQDSTTLVAAQLADRFIEVTLSTKPEALLRPSGSIQSHKSEMEELADGLAAFRERLISALAKQPIPDYGNDE